MLIQLYSYTVLSYNSYGYTHIFVELSLLTTSHLKSHPYKPPKKLPWEATPTAPPTSQVIPKKFKGSKLAESVFSIWCCFLPLNFEK